MADESVFRNNLICVHYPGVVKNETKMVETLGGLGNISVVFGEKQRRLEFHMRPDDRFCKPAYGNRKTVAGVLLKIRVKKKHKEVVSTEVMGYVTEEFRFTGLCDFQFIPTTQDECLKSKVLPLSLDLNWLAQDVPLFQPPQVFSRYDSVQNFSFFKGGSSEEGNVIGRIRRKRYGCTKVVSFETKEVPLCAKEIPFSGIISAKLITADMLNHLKKLFEERPIFSKTAITNVSELPLLQLKAMLPCVAYYFTNGPWRALWVRFGYDPRTVPESRIYQTLDYRVRSGVSKTDIKLKRGSTVLGQQNIKKASVPVIGISTIATTSQDNTDKKQAEQASHIFRPNMIPLARQCFYQYCDIEVPEIQALIESCPKREECHEAHGWFPQYVAYDCRHIMNNLVSEELKKKGRCSVAPHSEAIEGSDPESDYESVLSYLE